MSLERYAYIQANVDFLALEQLEELKDIHPTINVDELDEEEEKEQAEKDAAGKDDEVKEKEKKEDERKEEEEKKEEEPSNDFGGGYNAFGGGGYLYSMLDLNYFFHSFTILRVSYGGFGDTTSYGGFGGETTGDGGLLMGCTVLHTLESSILHVFYGAKEF